MERERVIDKIAKLMRHRDSAQAIGSEAEAAAFAEKIQELLIAHELEISEIKLTERDASDEKIDTEYFDYRRKNIPLKRVYEWQWTLARAVATAHFCSTLVPSDARSPYIVFVGKSANRTVATYMFEVLLRTVVNLADIEYLRHWKQELRGGDVTRLRGFKQSFYSGFANRVASRYYEKRKAADAASSSTALVLRNADSELAKYMQQFKGVGRRPRSESDNQTGFSAGMRAADSVSLDANGVGQGRGPKGSLQ